MREVGNLYIHNTKRRLIIGCISTLVSIPIMLCCLALLPTVVFPTLNKIATGGNENTPLVVMSIVALVSMIGLIGTMLIVAIAVIKRRARSLDAIFKPLGLTGSTYLIYGRHYQGQLDGREVDVYISRGPTVELRLRTTVQTRLQVVPKGSLPATVAGIFDKEPLRTIEPVLNAFSIYPIDPAWTLSLLSDPRAVDSIQALMTTGASWAVFRRVEVQPGEVLLYLYRSRKVFVTSIELDAVQTWLNALQTLAQAAERQLEPGITAQPFNATSRTSRQKTNKILNYAMVFIVGIMPLCFIAVGVIAYFIALSN